jgi:hypothetical protein
LDSILICTAAWETGFVIRAAVSEVNILYRGTQAAAVPPTSRSRLGLLQS